MDSELMIFEGQEVEVFEWEGIALFNPKDVALCLDITDVNSSMRKFSEKQVIKLKNSDIRNMNIRKLNNAGENFLSFNVRISSLDSLCSLTEFLFGDFMFFWPRRLWTESA